MIKNRYVASLLLALLLAGSIFGLGVAYNVQPWAAEAPKYLLIISILTYPFSFSVVKGWQRAHERVRVKAKNAQEGIIEIELPPPTQKFPLRALLFVAGNIAFCMVLQAMVTAGAGDIGWWSIFGILAGLSLIVTILSAITRLVLWIVVASGETAFSAAEALRRRKLKETIYGDAEGNPIDVSTLAADVTVGDDGELPEQSHSRDSR